MIEVEKKDLELASTPERAEFCCGTDGVLYGWEWWDIKFKKLDLSSKKQCVLGRFVFFKSNFPMSR